MLRLPQVPRRLELRCESSWQTDQQPRPSWPSYPTRQCTVASWSPTGLSDLECWWVLSQPTAVSLCPCACSTPFYWLIGLQPCINRSILGQLLWHSDVTKGHWQTLTEHLPVTGAYGVNVW